MQLSSGCGAAQNQPLMTELQHVGRRQHPQARSAELDTERLDPSMHATVSQARRQSTWAATQLLCALCACMRLGGSLDMGRKAPKQSCQV